MLCIICLSVRVQPIPLILRIYGTNRTFCAARFYETEGGDPEEVYCGLKRRQKKQFKRNKKEYTRLSDHIGLIPLVMVSPADTLLIAGGVRKEDASWTW